MNLLTPSRRVLVELGGTHPGLLAAAGPGTSAVQRAYAEVTALLFALEAAWAEIDRISADLTVQVGLPRVALPIGPGEPAAYAADAPTIRARLGPGPAASRLSNTLGRRQRRFRLQRDNQDEASASIKVRGTPI